MIQCVSIIPLYPYTYPCTIMAQDSHTRTSRHTHPLAPPPHRVPHAIPVPHVVPVPVQVPCDMYAENQRADQWSAFDSLNKAFADAVVPLHTRDSVVWVHGYQRESCDVLEYHTWHVMTWFIQPSVAVTPAILENDLPTNGFLFEKHYLPFPLPSLTFHRSFYLRLVAVMLVGAHLRAVEQSARIGFTLHIPFPSSEHFRAITSRREILSGIMAFSLVGFLLFDHCRHFLR